MPLRDRALVVGAAGAVGGADLDQPRARLRDHVGDAEAAADLDQLPARDDDLAPGPASAAAASSIAPAQLLTTIAASAPVSSHSSASTWSWREPRSPRSRSYSRFE